MIMPSMESIARDLFVYSGPIDRTGADKFVDMVNAATERPEGVSLFLTSYGGDADSAFRVARALSHAYENIRVLIAGQCKSAGTLVTLAANEIAFGPWGELGPLDVQLRKPDEIFSGHSGLDELQTLAIITDHGYDAFRQYVIDLTVGAGISTRSAAQIAASLVAGLLEPIAAQIDPHRLGEAIRAINIASYYGNRLATSNVRDEALDRLISGYPTHTFVIDINEARTLFEVVDQLTDDEVEIAERLQETGGMIRYPSEEAVILDVKEMFAASGESTEEMPDGDDGTRRPEALDGAEPRGAGADEASAGDEPPAVAAESAAGGARPASEK